MEGFPINIVAFSGTTENNIVQIDSNRPVLGLNRVS